jgi:hypothetical protein
MTIRTTVPTTPSDWRARRNNRALLRRMLRAIESEIEQKVRRQGARTS